MGFATRIGLAGEDVADLAQAVHDERGAGRDEVDDGLGQAEPRRDLDRPGDRDDVHGDALVREEPAGRVRVGRRDPQAGEVLDRPVRAVGRDGGGEPATAVAEVADAGEFGPGLAQQVDAGDAQVGDAVADEFDDVVRPDEQDVEVEVLDARDQASIVLLEDEARIVEQPQRRFDEPALVRDRQSQAFGHFDLSRTER